MNLDGKLMEEKITVKNRKGQNLSAILHTPEKETSKIIILTHSFKADKDYQPIMRDFSRRAEAEGYAVLRYDAFGSGESEGTFEESTMTTQVEDLEDMIGFVKSKGYTDICLAGLSQGATISTFAYDESIKCLVLWSPPCHHMDLYEKYKDEMLKQGFVIRKRHLTGEEVKVGKKMWEEFPKYDSKDKLTQVKCPTLAIVGTGDLLITAERVEKYLSLVPAVHKVEVIQGGDHDFLIKEAEEKAISISIDWVKKHL